MKFLRSVAIGFLFGFFVLSVQAESSGSNILLGGGEKSAEEGDVDAQYALGVMYFSGDGVRQDYVKAREWYEKAAAQGDASSHVVLGVMYFSGEGVRQSRSQAVEYFGKGCDLGEQVGCDLYREHRGTVTAK